MRSSDRVHLEELLTKACAGTLTRSDTMAMLMLFREHASKGSLLQDLGHMVAHHPRNRGVPVDQFDELIKDLDDAVAAGPTPVVLRFMYNIDLVIGEIVSTSKALGITVIRSDLASQRLLLAQSIASVIDGTEIVLKDARFKARIEGTTRAQWIVTPNVNLTGKGGTFPAGHEIRGNVLIVS